MDIKKILDIKYSRLIKLKKNVGQKYQIKIPENDLLCKVHNPLKRLFGHEKNRQSADYRSRYRFF